MPFGCVGLGGEGAALVRFIAPLAGGGVHHAFK